MGRKIIIDSCFCGPPDSGHGGYVCGLVAGFIEGTAEVTLHKPPPLNQPLDIEQPEGDKVVLRNGNLILAEARPSNIELNVPDPPTYAEAVEASKLAENKDHPFPTCFVCGTDRKEPDGLRIFPGKVSGKDMVAAPWIPNSSLADRTGKIRNEFIWAVLDCPGGWAMVSVQKRLALLGQLTAQIDNRLDPGEKCIIIGWLIEIIGRKIYIGTALFSESGKLIGKSKATWIELKSPSQ